MKQPMSHSWDCNCQWCVQARPRYEEGFGPKLPESFTVPGTGDGCAPLTWGQLLWGSDGRGALILPNSDSELDQKVDRKQLARLFPENAPPRLAEADRKNGYY